MILVDTSVWVDHFRGGEPDLDALLNNGRVLAHPFVIGELLLGNLSQRLLIETNLQLLPSAIVASDQEVLTFINSRRLFGRGIGFVDAHLLAATILTSAAKLWTRDLRLKAIAADWTLSAPLE